MSDSNGDRSAVDLPRIAAAVREILAAVGLAQNFGAVRALATEGIQKGHMSRHARAVAAAAGAAPTEVEAIAEALVAAGDVKVERARELLAGRRARSAGSPA